MLSSVTRIFILNFLIIIAEFCLVWACSNLCSAKSSTLLKHIFPSKFETTFNFYITKISFKTAHTKLKGTVMLFTQKFLAIKTKTWKHEIRHDNKKPNKIFQYEDRGRVRDMLEICSAGIDVVSSNEEYKTNDVWIPLPEQHIIPVEGKKVLRSHD